jgi:hypothetical protein
MNRRNRKSDLLLDLFARVAILEGVAGVAPGTWTGRGDAYSVARGVQAARTALPGAPEAWFVTGATPVLDALRAGAARTDDAEDVVMAVLDGSSRSADVVGGALYDAGKRIAGPTPALCDATNYLGWHASCRGSEAARRTRRIDLDAKVPEREWQAKDAGDRLDEVAASPASRAWILSVLEQVWAKAPTKLNVARMWLDDPSRTAVSIALELGYGLSAGGSPYVSAIIRDIPVVVRKNMSGHDVRLMTEGF